jgi:hypothetical protein
MAGLFCLASGVILLAAARRRGELERLRWPDEQ